MRTVTAQWFETKVRYEKTMEDGSQKKVIEKYVVNAMSFTEAESRITTGMSSNISGDFDVIDEKQAQYSEIITSGKEGEENWYKVKVDIIPLDERSGKEKRNRFVYLVQGGSIESARKNVDEVLGSTMMDFVIKSIVETKIVNIFIFKKEENSDGDND